ncbi:MAG: GTPase ObgE [Candidatus Saccharimonadales bacterium]
MNFIDQATVSVEAGNGGNGRASFRHEKFVSRGGPDGGDGGDGGDVILRASNNQDSLATFRYTKQLKAEDGAMGGNKKKHGKSGLDLVVEVPVGTEAKDENGNLVADLVDEAQSEVVAVGGRGGFGNTHFVSSRRQAPNFAEKGEPGQSLLLNLELKMLADVGLVGLPNAGKSTLLGAISHARPKVADYPFTTLNPSVGVVDIDRKSSLLFADIPGLIEGAAEGKGLGHDFLRHIERTSLIIHVVDAYVQDVAEAYLTVRSELMAYNPKLAKRPEIVVVNKIEGLDSEITNDLVSSLKRVIKPKSTQVLLISARSGEGLKELKLAAKAAKDKAAAKIKKPDKPELFEYRLPKSRSRWSITLLSADKYLISGAQIEKFALRTDFNNEQALARLVDILRKQGVLRALAKQGIKPGDKMDIAGKGEIIY